MSSRCRVLIITPAAAGRRGKNSLIKGIVAAPSTPLCVCVCVHVCLLINKTNRRILGARKKKRKYISRTPPASPPLPSPPAAPEPNVNAVREVGSVCVGGGGDAPSLRDDR